MQNESGLFCWTCQLNCRDQHEWNAHISSPVHLHALQQSNQMAYQQYYSNQQHYVPSVGVSVPQPFVNVYPNHSVPVGFAPPPYGHNYQSNVHQQPPANFHKQMHKRESDSQPKAKKMKKEKDATKTNAQMFPNKQSPNTSPKHTPNNSHNRSSAAGKKFYCQLCDCYTTDETALIAHYNGKKHAAKIQATTEQQSKNPPPSQIPPSKAPAESSSEQPLTSSSSPSQQPSIQPSETKPTQSSPPVPSIPSAVPSNQTSIHPPSSTNRSNHAHKTTKPFHTQKHKAFSSNRREQSQPKQHVEGNLIGNVFYGVQIPISKLHDHMYDNYLATVQSEITPSSTDTLAMENLLKLVLEALVPGDLIQETKIVGSYAKGTIIEQSPLIADVVVLMKEIPFPEQTAKIHEMISNRNTEATSRVEKSIIYLQGTGVTVKILLTWPDIWTRDKTLQDERFLEVDLPQAEIAMMALSHLHWFTSNVSPHPVLKSSIQLLKYYQSTHPEWKPLHPWAVDVLVFKSAMQTGFKGGLAFTLRSVFQYVSGGVLLDGAPGLPDPLRTPLDPSASTSQLESEIHSRDIAANLTSEQRQALTRNALETLIEISLHRWAHVLNKKE